jgi:hypothetical protein
MHLHINHMFCTDSCWSGIYHCRYSVTIHRIEDGKSYHDTPEQDWTNLTEQFSFFDEEEFNRRINESAYWQGDENERHFATKTRYKLKPEVLNWLNENIKDRKDEDHIKGWCIGTDNYLSRSPLEVSIFFHRKADALKFIGTWSIHKKPTTYFDYFKGIREKLDLATGKLVAY